MDEATEKLADPAFQAALQRRRRLRLVFSGFLIGIYLAWGIGGVYLPAIYAAPIPGLAMPVGLATAFMIIGLSMLLATVYVRKVNRYDDEEGRGR